MNRTPIQLLLVSQRTIGTTLQEHARNYIPILGKFSKVIVFYPFVKRKL